MKLKHLGRSPSSSLDESGVSRRRGLVHSRTTALVGRKYRLGQLLGRGAFGEVRLGKSLADRFCSACFNHRLMVVAYMPWCTLAAGVSSVTGCIYFWKLHTFVLWFKLCALHARPLFQFFFFLTAVMSL